MNNKEQAEIIVSRLQERDAISRINRKSGIPSIEKIIGVAWLVILGIGLVGWLAWL